MAEPGRELRPEFVVLGAAKAGTTSLYYYLRQHPGLYLPSVKELNFYSFDPESPDPGMGTGEGPGDEDATIWTDSLKTYEERYRAASQHQVRGEVSTSYLYSPSAPSRMAELVPDAQLFAVLRNPVERAWSHYLHMVRDGRETLDFQDALDAEEERIRKGWEFSWHYKKIGLYGQQISRYLDRFPSDRVHVYLFKELVRDTEAVVGDILSRIGASRQIPLDMEREHNRSGQIRSRMIARLLNRPHPAKQFLRKIVPVEWGHRVMETLRSLNLTGEKPDMPPKARFQLRKYYADDIAHLEENLDLDLSHWRSSG